MESIEAVYIRLVYIQSFLFCVFCLSCLIGVVWLFGGECAGIDGLPPKEEKEKKE